MGTSSDLLRGSCTGNASVLVTLSDDCVLYEVEKATTQPSGACSLRDAVLLAEFEESPTVAESKVE